MRAIITSFYTHGTGYEAEAQQLESSARAFGLLTDIRGVPNLGDWCHNCAIKPAFIRDRMNDYPHRPIVWLDADARVRQTPELFDNLTCDFAAHWRHGVELLSGTMYFAPTPAAKQLATAWAEAQMRRPGEWDQRVLQDVIETVPDLVVERLPKEYTRVFDDSKMGVPIIEHMQASRRLA